MVIHFKIKIYVVSTIIQEEDGLIVNNVVMKYSTFLSTLFKNNKEVLRNNLLKSFNIKEKAHEEKSEKDYDNQSETPLGPNDEDKKDDDTDIEIKVKNEWFIKFKSIILYFFKYEYSLLTIWIREPTSMLKTDLISIFFIRVIASLSIVALLSPDNSEGSEEESSSVNILLINKS